MYLRRIPNAYSDYEDHNMLILITGGSGSGKSALAEKLTSKLSAEPEYEVTSSGSQTNQAAPIYIATMIAGQDQESRERIVRHQLQRSHLGFCTIEQPFDLELLLDQIQLEKTMDSAHGAPVLLLECLSNLLANEMFLRTDHGLDYFSPEQAAEVIDHALLRAEDISEHLIIVSNEIFADALVFDEATQLYLKYMGWLNQRLAARAALAVEMVYGSALVQRGSAKLLEGLI